MAFTMHSHSGEFCPGHAKDELYVIVQRAFDMGFTVMGLTEHMPRLAVEDLYPEELEPTPEASLAEHLPRHELYLGTAQILRDKFLPQGMRILIGFETDWIRADDYAVLVNELKTHPAIDYFIGSVHHVLGEPVDYDKATYSRACDASIAAGYLPEPEALGEDDDNLSEEDKRAERGERALYNAYFAAQHEMLVRTHPKVVGHLDVIRLLSRNPARSLQACWPEVWQRVLANLRVAREQDGILECNSSALRKGLAEPYPTREIAEAWVGMGGKFCLSDDSHGIAQLGTNYGRMLDFLESVGVDEVWTLERTGSTVGERGVKVADVRACLSRPSWTS